LLLRNEAPTNRILNFRRMILRIHQKKFLIQKKK